jgi:hypothetical protein
VDGKIFFIVSFSNQTGKEGIVDGYSFKNWFPDYPII